MKTFEQFNEEFLKDPAKKAAYDSLEVEFKIYDALVKARIEKKLTQKQLASKLGIAQSALARFESGRGNPTLSFLQKITTGLGLKLTVI
ncbi:MAG: helix-turn-helix transcriptional regulator [Candidatus Taylorbacteria bacterium]|nr:helix-turn-helix transcriptional regulator [Candidatus Taylorbacteria bacterium]